MKNWIFHALKVRIFGIRLQRLEKYCLQKFLDKSYEKLTNISGMYSRGAVINSSSISERLISEIPYRILAKAVLDVFGKVFKRQ